MVFSKILKDSIVHISTKEKFEINENSYLIELDRLVKVIFEEILEEYKNIEVENFGDLFLKLERRIRCENIKHN